MKVTYDNEKKMLKIEITEEIDHHMAEKIRSKADFEIQSHMPKQVIIDFSNVTFMDSAGIGLLIGRYKMTKMFGGTINMINVKPNVKKVFEMTGILRLIPIIEEIEGGEKLG